MIFFISSCTSFNYQFDDSQEQGIKIVNNTISQKTIYLRFLIPGLSEKESRNSGTKLTLYPGQSKVYYLPEETMVVATDGPYWDNPNPQKPNEREVLYVKKDIIWIIMKDKYKKFYMMFDKRFKNLILCSNLNSDS